MGKENFIMAYPKDLLSTRAIIEHGRYALIPPEGLVNNQLPFFEKCTTSIIASPKLGASFVQYLIEMEPEGKTTKPFGGNGIESFVFVREGALDVIVDNEKYELTQGGYVYCPPHLGMTLENNSKSNTKLILYKQKYIAVEGLPKPWVVCNNINNLEARIYEGMEDVTLIDLLPTDMAFDMNMHILTFQPGGSHPFIETHVQEHGAYLLSGQGVYYLDNKWIPVKKGDFIWMGPFIQQATYAVGHEPLSYIYSKDCNRDAEI